MAVVSSPDRPNLAQLELSQTIAPETWEAIVALQNHVAADSEITLFAWAPSAGGALTIPAATALTQIAALLVRVPASIDEVTITTQGLDCSVTVDGTTLTHGGTLSVQTATQAVTPDADIPIAISVASTPGGVLNSVQIRYSPVAVP